MALPRAAGLGTGLWSRSYWASRALSLSSFPHSQSFPGSTAKCKGSSLCSESVRGMTAETEERERERNGDRLLTRLPGGWEPQQNSELCKGKSRLAVSVTGNPVETKGRHRISVPGAIRA